MGAVHSAARAVIACASGKGGVGKSTVAVNFAYMLGHLGLKVGLLDLDIYGPSLPELIKLPSDCGRRTESGLLVPIDYGEVAIMSWGYIQPGQSMTIRAPIANQIVNQLLTGVDWGALDVLVVDTPPGTGDVLLSLSQTLAVDGAVLVTTANELSLADVVKGMALFEKVEIPTLLTVVNMATFCCQNCCHEQELFVDGAINRLPDFLNAKSVRLMKFPFDPELSKAPLESLPPISHMYPFVRNPDLESRPAWESFRRMTHGVLAALLGIGVTGTKRPGPSSRTTTARLRLLAEGKLSIRLSNGDTRQVECSELRAMCKCAHCVDDLTGEVKVNREQIRKDRSLHALEVKPKGNYGVSIRWSDSHCSLIALKAVEELVMGPQVRESRDRSSW